MADALSDVLRRVHLTGGVFLHAEFTEPWCVSSQASPDDCRPVLSEVDHLVLYHYVIEGRLQVQVANDAPLEIRAGEAVVLPRNDVHRIGSDISRSAVESHDIIQVSPQGGLAMIRHGGGGARTRLICGFLGCRRLDDNPLLRTLPAALRVDTRAGAAAEWMRASLEFAAEEIAGGRAGSDIMLAKLSELLFIEAVQRHVEDLPAEQVGWLAGLRDPVVGRTLALIHGRTNEPWTVDDLAREAGLSRSALADRFSRLIGEPPMHYLARWRLQVAAQRLRTSRDPLARIAFDVGYESEAAFSRAFKRRFGTPPATWRRQAEEAAAA